MNDIERDRGEGDSLCIFQRTKYGTNFLNMELFYIPSIEEEEEAEEDEEEEAISRPLYTPQWNTPHTHTVTHNQTRKSVKCERITKAHATKRNTHKNKKRKENKTRNKTRRRKISTTAHTKSEQIFCII